MLSMSNGRDILYARVAYTPPPWVSAFVADSMIPHSRINLGQMPTPMHPLRSSKNRDITSDSMLNVLDKFQFWMKRDDLSSFDLTGNKIRKLEFLLADAMEKGHESVITIGGLQSNHARATAVAAAQLGLNAHLILRTPLPIEEIDLTGNLLFNHMSGAHIHTVSPGTYAQIGSVSITHQLAQQLVDASHSEPYIIPVGGSNAVGLFGYLDCVDEILHSEQSFDHVVFACGSGGTAMGMALGFRLAKLHQPTLKVPKVHAVNVCDRPEYFYHHMEEISLVLGLDLSKVGNPRDWLSIYPGVGTGYARSTDEELAFIRDFGQRTGIVLDPVYGGKALFYFLQKLTDDSSFRETLKEGDKVLFVHTGGTFGLYEKASQMRPLLQPGQVTKMKVHKSP